MPTLTREQILKADDLVTEIVDVPEWNGSVIIRTITGIERDQLEASIVTDSGEKNMDNLRAKLIVLSVVDEDGKRMFNTVDIVALGGKSAAALSRIFTVAMKLSGFSKEEVEKLTENLSKGQSENSTSN